MKRGPHLLFVGLLAACAGHAAAPSATAPARGQPAPVATAAPREPSVLRYAAGTGRYHEFTQSAQELMGQSQSFDTHVYFSTAATAVGTNLGVTVTVDSMTTTVPGAVGVEQVRGRTINLVFTPTGRSISMASSDTTMAMLQIADGMRELLPSLPAGAITAGATWTDTVSRQVPAPDATLTVTAQRQHRVVGWEDHDGVRALHISTSSTYTLNGTGQAQGQSLTFTGTGRNQAEHFVSAAGVYLGSVGGDTADVNVNVASAGMQVAVHRMQHSVLTRLP